MRRFNSQKFISNGFHVCVCDFLPLHFKYAEIKSTRNGIYWTIDWQQWWREKANDWNTPYVPDDLQTSHGNKSQPVENSTAHSYIFARAQCIFLKLRFAQWIPLIPKYTMTRIRIEMKNNKKKSRIYLFFPPTMRVSHIAMCAWGCWRVKLLIWTCRCLSSVAKWALTKHTSRRTCNTFNSSIISTLTQPPCIYSIKRFVLFRRRFFVRFANGLFDYCALFSNEYISDIVRMCRCVKMLEFLISIKI